MRRRDFIAGGLVTAKLSKANWLSSDGAQHLYNLDYERALNAFESECKRDLAGDAYNDLASAILYSVLFKADALDGAVALEISDYLHKPKVILPAADRLRFQRATRKSEEIARMLLAKNPNDAAALFTLGQAFTERANLALLADKEWRVALKASGEARKLHLRVLALDGTMIDALLVPSAHEYIIGSLPPYLKAMGFLFGLSGNKEKGLAGLRKVAVSGNRTKMEAQVLLALLERREDRPDLALPTMRKLATAYQSNHLYRREVVNLLLDMKKKDEARSEISQLSDVRYRFLRPERKAVYQNEFEARMRA